MQQPSQSKPTPFQMQYLASAVSQVCSIPESCGSDVPRYFLILMSYSSMSVILSPSSCSLFSSSSLSSSSYVFFLEILSLNLLCLSPLSSSVIASSYLGHPYHFLSCSATCGKGSTAEVVACAMKYDAVTGSWFCKYLMFEQRNAITNRTRRHNSRPSHATDMGNYHCTIFFIRTPCLIIGRLKQW